MTVESFCHSWILSTLSESRFAVWEVHKRVAWKISEEIKKNKAYQQSINSGFCEDAASTRSCIKSRQIDMPGSKVVATRCLGPFVAFFSHSSPPSEHNAQRCWKGDSSLQSPSWVEFLQRQMDRGSAFPPETLPGTAHRCAAWPPRLQLNPCPSPLLLFAFAHFQLTKIVRGMSPRIRLAQGICVLEPCLQPPCFLSHL